MDVEFGGEFFRAIGVYLGDCDVGVVAEGVEVRINELAGCGSAV